MSRSSVIETDFSKYLQRWSGDLKALRQNWLLDESALVSFARDRGILATGELGDFHKKGLLSADERRHGLLFHPFRLYVLREVHLATRNRVAIKAREWNGITDLAILLEPIYWPGIVGTERIARGDKEHYRRMANYRRRVFRFLTTLNPLLWEKIHADLRISAAWMDQNGELYLLLRLSSWEQREHLRGAISGALWIRHMAEVIRRGFEEVHQVQWAEEDRAFGIWHSRGRVMLLGSERPLDDPLRSKPYLAHRFGLFTGSAVCWYVEGETEYYAILQVLEDPPRMGIELVNLQGEIAGERRNAARKLEAALRQDLGLGRFSVISFDLDVEANKRAIRRQVEQEHVIGAINANNPDFEFANFSLRELVEVAASLDDQMNFDGERVRQADWTGISNARSFENLYLRVSERRRSLKGKDWGEALAAYALKHMKHEQNGLERPFLRAASSALWAWNSNYTFHKEHFKFDPVKFELQTR